MLHYDVRSTILTKEQSKELLEVAKRADKATDGFKSQTSTMKMTLINAQKEINIRDLANQSSYIEA